MLSDYLPVFGSKDHYAHLKDYIRQNRGNADFVLFFDEADKKFLDLWRLDMTLGLGSDLSKDGWHGLMCFKFYFDWWHCCSCVARQMFLDESTGLLMQQARYRSTIVGAYPKGAFVISMEAEPVSLQDHRPADVFATINRGVIREPFDEQPVFWQPKLVTKEGAYLEDKSKALMALARKRFYELDLSPFTNRQTEVLTAIADGLEKNDEIGSALGISPWTVETHRKSISQEGASLISKYLLESKSVAWYMRSQKLI